MGARVHTLLHALRLPVEGAAPPKISAKGLIQPQTAPYSGYFYETPQSLACIYGLTAQVTGCNPKTATAIPTPPSKPLAIAIVDAYDNPSALSDLQYFATQFGLPDPTSHFNLVYAGGSQPPADAGWAIESSLDIEWAYAMSPTATIYLVEAASNSFPDMMTAVQKANDLVAAAGGGFVSQSWGGTEFPGETGTGFDSVYAGASPKVTFLASSGDSPGVIWPSTSPYVVAVGGTSLSRNPATGNIQGELTWQQGGGGLSAYESRPSYQNSTGSITGGHRGTPDIAAVADPDTGVWVYAGYNGGWYIVGGTSVSSPVSAGILSWKGKGTTALQQMLRNIYLTSVYRDVTSGNCGPYAGWVAAKGYDLCTGMGSIAAGATPLVARPSSYAP